MLPPLFTVATAKRILEGHRRVSLDLGLSQVDILLEGDNIKLPDGIVVSFRDLERIRARDNAVFFPKDGSFFQIAISNSHFHKLVPTTGAPTLEIDGIRMHRTKGTTPEVDALSKIDALGVRCGKILDTCTGLGYTALTALKQGGDLVVSIERRPEVLRIAELNPWSRGLFVDERVHLLIGDAYSLSDSFPDGFFDCIVHDPPAFNLAGDLYAGAFYQQLYRVLRRKGRLFHYIGDLESKSGRTVSKGAMKRLREAGFSRVLRRPEAFGLVAYK